MFHGGCLLWNWPEIMDGGQVTESEVDPWHGELVHTRRSQLAEETSQTPGMQRFEAISGARSSSSQIWMGENHVAGGVRSGNHHHGASETGIYVVSGNPVFVFKRGDEERRIETQPGDYVFVPPFIAHREENPGPGEAVVVLARSTQEAIVVNLDHL